jgi:CheY-like chemotaxis protein
MGGDLTVESELGRGSTFTIRVPSHIGKTGGHDDPARPVVTVSAAPDFIDAPALVTDGGAAIGEYVAEGLDGEGPADLKSRIASLGRPLHVLIADDDEANRIVAAKMLRDFDMEFTMACDGVEAVEAAARTSFDIVLMDMRMPNMDGMKATQAIRALGGQCATIPIVAFTGNGFVEDVTACLQAGMNDFVFKPVRKKVLVNAVSRVLSGNEAIPTDPVSCETGPLPIEWSPGTGPDTMFDQMVFDNLADVVGLVDAHKIAQVFVKETEDRLRRLRELSSDADRETIEREAHSIKSGAATVGMLQLAQVAELLERKAPVILPGDYSLILDELATAFALSRVHLPESPISATGCDIARVEAVAQ